MVLEKKFNATLSNYGMEKLEIVQRYQIILFDNNVSYVIRLWYGKNKVGNVIRLWYGKKGGLRYKMMQWENKVG